MLAENVSEPLPIASITKLLTAMIVIDDMNLDTVLETPVDIKEVERHTVGIRPGDLLTVRDLLHGMLIESGNDCAEVLARSYPKGGRAALIAAMNRRAAQLGASRTHIYTPSGLDLKFMLGRKDHRSLFARKPNLATAEEVAVIAREAFKYPLIREISGMKSYTMRTRNQTPRDYALAANDKLLYKDLPLAGAKTGFTNLAGKCIVARFKNEKSDYMVVVLNTSHHFKAAEKIYRWVCKTF
jgi:D-alanyl-D-alanine carboxypeptidase